MLNNKIFTAVLIILAFWLASFVLTFSFRFLKRFARETKTDLDDRLLKTIEQPLRYLAVLLGFYFATAYAQLNWNWRGLSLDGLFYTLIVLLVAYSLSHIAKEVLSWWSEKKEVKLINETTFVFIRKVISASVYLLAALVVLKHFGIEIGPMLAGLGVAGLAIALGLQETLANLFAALYLVMDKSINIGDYIKLEDGTRAYIEDISWRSTRIRTIGGNTIIIPNSKFISQNIASYDYPESPFRTSVIIGVSYYSDLDLVEKVARQAANNVIAKMKIKVPNNKPMFRFHELTDSAINIKVMVKVDSVRDERRVKSALIKELVEQFHQHNIEIPYPQRVVHMRGHRQSS